MYGYKLVVLLSALGAAAAGPGAVLASAPLIYSRAVLSPAITTITRSASSVVHPSPLVYSTPFHTHFIKKRSAVLAPVGSYLAPTTYAAGPLVTSAYTTPVLHQLHGAPLVHAGPVTYTAPLHLLKKRSAPLAYFASPAHVAYSLPGRVTLAHPLQPAAAVLAPAPFAYTTHFIKKRSAGVAFLAPASSVSHQSRVDIHSAPSVITTFTAPLIYKTPIIHSHFF